MGCVASGDRDSIQIGLETKEAQMIADAAASGGLDWTCLDVFRAAPIERIAMIKSGVRARWAKNVLGGLAEQRGPGLPMSRLSGAALKRKAALGVRLSHEQSEHVVELAKLIGQVQAMVEESGCPKGFDAAAWLGEWASAPLPALGGELPMDYLDTWDGRAILSGLLAQMQSAAYA